MRRLLCRLTRHVPPLDYRLRGPSYECTRCGQTIKWRVR